MAGTSRQVPWLCTFCHLVGVASATYHIATNAVHLIHYYCMCILKLIITIQPAADSQGLKLRHKLFVQDSNRYNCQNTKMLGWKDSLTMSSSFCGTLEKIFKAYVYRVTSNNYAFPLTQASIIELIKFNNSKPPSP